MSYVQYAYIAKPTAAQVSSFFRSLQGRGVCISHLGKSDPPRAFCGTLEEAVNLVFGGTDLTDYTFARAKARKLDFQIEIHHDSRWTHSTVSASCPDVTLLALLTDSAAAAFDLFITIQGVSGGGKEQAWQVLDITERCPDDLRSRFVAA